MKEVRQVLQSQQVMLKKYMWQGFHLQIICQVMPGVHQVPESQQVMPKKYM